MATRRASSTMFGRDEALTALETAVDDRAARPVTLVAGEAGVGKTRLVAEFLARRDGSALTTVGACIDLGADHVPYAPFVDALGRYVEELVAREPDGPAAFPADLRTVLGELGTIVPNLPVLLPDPAARPAPDGSMSRARLYEAVRALLDEAPEPLLCVLEDLHWADASSLELLAYLARRLRRGRTAIVATFRTDDLHRRHPLVPLLAELERSGRTTRIDVGRLGPADAGALIRAIRADAPEHLVQAITQRSEGIPFLVEELLALDAEAGAPLPETLRELLLARLAALSEPARAVLSIVAAVERPADGELLEAAWDRPREELEPALREAVGRGLLAVDPSTGRVGFRHALLGEAVADDLLPGERIRLHAAVAGILVDRPDLARPTAAGAAAEIAHHFHRAHDFPAALRASVTAGDAAMAARAHAEARAQYERALELVELLPGGRGEAWSEPSRLLDAAAEASFHAGDVGRAVALGTRAVQVTEAGGDLPRTGYLLARLVEWTELSGDFDRVSELAARAVALVPATPPSRERAYALVGLAAALGHAGRARECLAVAREAVEVAVASGAAAQEAIARSNAAAALSLLGRDAEAVVEIDRAAILADHSRGSGETGVVQTDRAVIRAMAARFTDLADVLEQARAALDREGSLEVHESWVVAPETELLAWQGRWAEAEALATREIERQGAGPRATHLLLRGKLRARTGRLDDASADLQAALQLRPLAEPEIRADALAGLAELALLRADPDQAMTCVDEALRVLEPTDALPVRVHVLALGLEAAVDAMERERPRTAGRQATAAEDAVSRYGALLRAAETGELAEAGALEERVRSRVAWGVAEEARGRDAATPETWATAAAALVAAGEPHLAARCWVRQAEVLLACSADKPGAAALLRAASAWGERVGAAPLLGSIHALARRARLDLAAADGDGAADQPTRPSQRLGRDRYGLSEREREVLSLLVDGRTNREIGEHLFISEKTASVHVTHILDKLGVASRGAAAALAARTNLVSDRT